MAVRELRRKVKAINTYVDRKRSALECMRELSLKQPGGVELTLMHYKKGESMTVSGTSPDVGRVYKFKESVEESELFSAVKLDGPQRVKGKEVFEIEAQLPGDEE